ncbi:MAG TPA: hypothetical protein VF534_17525 [Paraburkholderia sp.]
MIVVDLPAARWVEKKGDWWLSLVFAFFGLSLLYWWFVCCGGRFGLLAFPCDRGGLLALPLCGAAPTFFAAAKKVGKESRFTTANS